MKTGALSSGATLEPPKDIEGGGVAASPNPRARRVWWMRPASSSVCQSRGQAASGMILPPALAVIALAHAAVDGEGGTPWMRSRKIRG